MSKIGLFFGTDTGTTRLLGEEDRKKTRGGSGGQAPQYQSGQSG